MLCLTASLFSANLAKASYLLCYVRPFLKGNPQQLDLNSLHFITGFINFSTRRKVFAITGINFPINIFSDVRKEDSQNSLENFTTSTWRQRRSAVTWSCFLSIMVWDDNSVCEFIFSFEM